MKHFRTSTWGRISHMRCSDHPCETTFLKWIFKNIHASKNILVGWGGILYELHNSRLRQDPSYKTQHTRIFKWYTQKTREFQFISHNIEYLMKFYSCELCLIKLNGLVQSWKPHKQNWTPVRLNQVLQKIFARASCQLFHTFTSESKFSPYLWVPFEDPCGRSLVRINSYSIHLRFLQILHGHFCSCGWFEHLMWLILPLMDVLKCFMGAI